MRQRDRGDDSRRRGEETEGNGRRDGDEMERESEGDGRRGGGEQKVKGLDRVIRFLTWFLSSARWHPTAPSSYRRSVTEFASVPWSRAVTLPGARFDTHPTSDRAGGVWAPGSIASVDWL